MCYHMDPLFRLTRAPAVSLGALVASAAELQTGIPLAGNVIDTLAKQLRGLTFWMTWRTVAQLI